MDPLQEVRRYVELRLAECRTRPELHRHQIGAYQNVLAKIDGTGDTGDMFEVAQAESLDRYHNLVRIHRATEDDRRVRAAFVSLNAARSATGHGDLATKMEAAAMEGTNIAAAAAQADGAVRELLIAVLDWALENNPEARRSRLAVLRQHAQTLAAADPGFTWRRIHEYPPYRARIPFDDELLAHLGAWFEEAMRS